MNSDKQNNKNKYSSGGGVEFYREKIIEMASRTKEERFLKAIYISMSDYLEESEPE